MYSDWKEGHGSYWGKSFHESGKRIDELSDALSV